MSDFKIGDRVKVVSDLTGIDAFVGRAGVVVKEARYYRGTLAVDPAVRLDGRDPVILRDLHFAPEELELIVPDAEADAADAKRDMDRAEQLLGGAR